MKRDSKNGSNRRWNLLKNIVKNADIVFEVYFYSYMKLKLLVLYVYITLQNEKNELSKFSRKKNKFFKQVEICWT